MASTDTLFVLNPRSYSPPAANYATLGNIQDASTPGANFPVLLFDTSTSEHADWELTVPSHYAGGGFTISWKGGTSNTDVGTFELEFRCIVLSNADVLTADLGIDTATAVAITDTPPATPQDKLNYSTTGTLSHANAGSPSAGDRILIRATRDTATDTNTGDLQLQEVLIIET